MLLENALFMKIREILIVGYPDIDKAGPKQLSSTLVYFFHIGVILISWKSKSQNVVTISSVKVEYRGMTFVTCEMIWLKKLHKELKLEENSQMYPICDNQVAFTLSLILSFMRGPSILR